MASNLRWWPQADVPVEDTVAIVTVNYNTKELTGLLLWSLWRVLDGPSVQPLVVDNGSSDGSLELLREAEAAGLCTLIANDLNLQHGPALNQALSFLAEQPAVPRRVWILDSDCVVARSDTLGTLLELGDAEPAIVGERHWDPWLERERFELYSLFIDPARVWQPEIERFADDGDPSLSVLDSASAAGLPMAELRFAAEGYVVHRGRGTLAAVFSNDERANPHFDWAVDHHEPHFAGIAGAAETWNALQQRFRDEVGELTGAALASACHRDEGAA